MRSPGARTILPTLALLAGSASAGSRPGALPDVRPGPAGGTGTAPAAAGACSPAAIADVLLGAPVPVDEIRVIVRDGSPASAAAEVTVASEGSDRVLHIRGGSHGLKFYPALTSSAFRVSLLPVLDSPVSPCVDRIELRRAGAAVAVVSP